MHPTSTLAKDKLNYEDHNAWIRSALSYIQWSMTSGIRTEQAGSFQVNGYIFKRCLQKTGY